jgi:hypothetical protein
LLRFWYLFWHILLVYIKESRSTMKFNLAFPASQGGISMVLVWRFFFSCVLLLHDEM